MARVIVITPNPAIDTTYAVESQAIGESHRVLTVHHRPGGKGINVARGLLALGHDPVCVLPLGATSGTWVAHALDDLALETSVTAIAGTTRTCVAVTDTVAHPTVFNEPGPEVTTAEWALLVADVERLLPDAALLVVSGSLPRGTDVAVVTGIVAAARAAGVPCLLDVAGDSLLAAADAGADVLKPNAEELLAATGADTVEAGVADLRARGARLVVVSRGTDGLVATDASGEYAAAAIPGVRGNPTGAGDAATAGLAAALLDGRTVPDALSWAAALGAAAVLREVAGEVDIAAFERFLTPDPDPDESSPA